MRQKSYILRKQMTDQRRDLVGWLQETLVTDSGFRAFQLRIDREYDAFYEDEKYWANLLGVRVVHSLLNELLEHFDEQISEDEWLNLKWNMGHASARPHVQAAYLWVKEGYSKQKAIGKH